MIQAARRPIAALVASGAVCPALILRIIIIDTGDHRVMIVPRGFLRRKWPRCGVICRRRPLPDCRLLMSMLVDGRGGS